MVLAGDVKIGYDKYFIAIKYLKKKEYYFLYSTDKEKDFDSADPETLHHYTALADVDASSYVLEAIQKSRVTGKISIFGKHLLLHLVMDALSFARIYTFSPDSVELNSIVMEVGQQKCTFAASDETLVYQYMKKGDEFSQLFIKKDNITIDLKEFNFKPGENKIHFQESDKEVMNHILISTMKNITVDDLDASLDMSWYHSDGKVHKNYSNAKSIAEFELKVMTPIIKGAIEARKKGKPFIVSLDTETTGLKIYNLSVSNAARSHCVSIQLSWEEDQGVAIFNDMEHFQNVDVAYVLKRLTELFGWFQGERTVEYYEPVETYCAADFTENVSTGDNSEIQKISAFSEYGALQGEETSNPTTQSLKEEFLTITEKSANEVYSLDKCEKKIFTFIRSLFFLVGHNFPFDRRVCYQTNMTDIWFNADTLQMAFDINPRTVRGSGKLKLLTRKIFGHETPELTDVLGKGNEDKFRYLETEEVANIYGCADVDYTRKLFLFLRKLMPEHLWLRYLQQDVDIANILAISEYYGLMTYTDKVMALGEQTYQNIEILKDAAYKYVGAYLDYNEKASSLKAAYLTGELSEEQFMNQLKNVHADPYAVYKFEFKASSLRQVLYDTLHYPIKAYTEGKQKLPKVDKYVIKKLIEVKRTPNSKARKLEHDILAYGVDRAEYDRLKRGNKKDKKKAESMRLVSAEEFNNLEYPLALLIREYASLNKEYTSYYKPILNENLEGKMFKGYNLARIETRRISNPLQTMKGNLKALVRSYSDDYYVLDFDMSQVEYRIMLSLAEFMKMVDKMKNPERDYHTETASMVNGIPPHKVSKKLRKMAKSVSFGVPYGLGDMSLCETMFGEVTEENLTATRVVLAMWKKNNSPIMTLLEDARAEALTEWEISDDLREFIGAWKKDPETKEFLLDKDNKKIPQPVSRVTNRFGFYRVFNLKDVEQTPEAKQRRASGKFNAAESSIRRQAGNFPIQSFAAEVFRIILTRFYWRCVKEGISDKIIWHMLIHDELLCSVHKSIHPFFIYKIVKEECMITMKNHTKYFVGINIGDTWAECKDDAREAPIYFVERMIKKWENGDFIPEKTPKEFLRDGNPSKGYWFDHPWDFIKPYNEQYHIDRIYEVISEIEEIDDHPINVPKLLKEFDNYTVRAYVNDYSENTPVEKEDFLITVKKNGDKVYDDECYDNAVWSSKLETWAIMRFGEGKEFINAKGELIRLTKCQSNTKVVAEESEFIDFDELFANEFAEDDENDDYWSFDESDIQHTFLSETEDESEVEEFDPLNYLDLSKAANAKNVAEMQIQETKYKSIKVFGNQIQIHVSSKEELAGIKKLLLKYRSSSGNLVCFKDIFGKIERWITISSQLDLMEIDEEVYNIKHRLCKTVSPAQAMNACYKSFKCFNGKVYVTFKNLRQLSDIEKFISRTYKEDASGMSILLNDALGVTKNVYFIRCDSDLQLLDRYLIDWR